MQTLRVAVLVLSRPKTLPLRESPAVPTTSELLRETVTPAPVIDLATERTRRAAERTPRTGDAA